MFTNGRLELLTKYREDMRDGQEQPLFGKSVRFELAECPEAHCRRVKITVVDVVIVFPKRHGSMPSRDLKVSARSADYSKGKWTKHTVS